MKYTLLILALVLAVGCVSVKRGPAVALREAKRNHVTFDAIIVPGIPFENGSWDSVMKARVLWSYVLYKNGITKNIIYSGSAVYSPYYEAKIMGLYAQKLGVQKKHIFYDTLARHSTENAYYSYLLARKLGFKTVALATDPFQSALLKSFTINKFGTIMYHMPFVMDSVRKYSALNPKINPESAKKDNFVSITDKESGLQRFMGTIGRDIDWKQYKHRKLPPL